MPFAFEHGIRSSEGFTIVELMIIVTILGIMAMVSLPAIEPTQLYKLDLAAGELANGIRFARGEAMRTANPHGIELDPILESVRVYRGDTLTSPPTPVYDVYHPVTRMLYELDIDDDAPTQGVTFTTAPIWSAICNSPLLVGFDSLGTPRCGNPLSTILLSGTVTLTQNGHSRTVVIDGTTGRVTVQ